MMSIEALYTHDDSSPPEWIGRTIGGPPVAVTARDLPTARRRLHEGVVASGIRRFELVEWQGVRLQRNTTNAAS